MTRALPHDYDSDPERWRTGRRVVAAYLKGEDVHGMVAARFAAAGCRTVLDIGCGFGRLAQSLPSGLAWTGIDSSPTMLAEAPRPVVRADAVRLPFASGAFDAAAAMYMLYHLEEPLGAIREAYRVLRPGGVFAASAPSRRDAPELDPIVAPEPQATFDAENAPELVGAVFERVEVSAWDTPAYELPDETALRQYLRGWGYRLTGDPRSLAFPLTLTKRGAVIYGFKKT